jgi:hypothetical protein
MKHFFIKQAVFLPLIYFIPILIAGFFAQDYSHWGQHASELGINSMHSAVVLFQTGILLTSLSMFVMATGLILNFGRKFILTASLVFLFAVTFVSGAIVPIGSPWHGLYGVGMIVMILPFVFLYEQKDLMNKRTIHFLTLAAGFLMFFYLWTMVARLDPVNLRGLTQRLFGIVVFGWLALVAWHLDSVLKRKSGSSF